MRAALAIALLLPAAAFAQTRPLIYPPSGQIEGVPDAQTPTNKTIDCTTNTCLNFPSAPHNPIALTWTPGINPNTVPMAIMDQTLTVRAITCRVEAATGATSTVTLVKAGSGTALSAGTALHTGSCNANPGTLAQNQTLTLVGGATDTLNPGDTVGLTTTGGTAWTSPGTGVGAIVVSVSP